VNHNKCMIALDFFVAGLGLSHGLNGGSMLHFLLSGLLVGFGIDRLRKMVEVETETPGEGAGTDKTGTGA
jgi:hypothetical protein